METAEPQTKTLTDRVKRAVKASHGQKAAVVAPWLLEKDAMEALCALVQQEGRRRERLSRRFSIVTSLSMFAMIVIDHYLPREGREWWDLPWEAAAFVGIFGTFWVWNSEQQATNFLARIDDLHAIGPILDALTAYPVDRAHRTQRSMLRGSLVHLLRRLHAGATRPLLPHHITVLNRELKLSCRSYRVWKVRSPYWKERNLEFATAALKALEQIGDETSIPAVEYVLEKMEDPSLCKAAEACLPFLRMHAQQGKHSLLRPAGVGADHLLIPAHGSSKPPLDDLLRAAPHVSQDNLQRLKADRP